jgi:anti-sigma regulatory factor (Ser/Thr protein kinase)
VVGPADTDDVFRARLPATPGSIGLFRGELWRWLERLSIQAAQIFDVVLACSEWLTLVIEQQPRTVALVVDVQATIEGGYLVVTTRDYGLWDELHARDETEAFGLVLMRALMDSVELERHRDGQLITLRKRVTTTDDGEPHPLSS